MEKVICEGTRERYENIWIPSFIENNIILDCPSSLANAEEFILKKNGRDIGSIAFVKYTEKSEINLTYNFMEVACIRNNVDNVVEVDYVSLLKEERNEENLQLLLYSIFCYEIQNRKNLCVSLYNPSFFVYLTRFIKIPLRRVNTTGGSLNKGLVPCYLDLYEITKLFNNPKSKCRFFLDYTKKYNPELIEKLELTINTAEEYEL